MLAARELQRIIARAVHVPDRYRLTEADGSVRWFGSMQTARQAKRVLRHMRGSKIDFVPEGKPTEAEG
jgi:hypothetical protein